MVGSYERWLMGEYGRTYVVVVTVYDEAPAHVREALVSAVQSMQHLAAAELQSGRLPPTGYLRVVHDAPKDGAKDEHRPVMRKALADLPAAMETSVEALKAMHIMVEPLLELERNHGDAAARNVAIEATTGDVCLCLSFLQSVTLLVFGQIIMFLDGDDVVKEEHVTLMWRALAQEVPPLRDIIAEGPQGMINSGLVCFARARYYFPDLPEGMACQKKKKKKKKRRRKKKRRKKEKKKERKEKKRQKKEKS